MRSGDHLSKAISSRRSKPSVGQKDAGGSDHLLWNRSLSRRELLTTAAGAIGLAAASKLWPEFTPIEKIAAVSAQVANTWSVYATWSGFTFTTPLIIGPSHGAASFGTDAGGNAIIHFVMNDGFSYSLLRISPAIPAAIVTTITPPGIIAGRPNHSIGALAVPDGVLWGFSWVRPGNLVAWQIYKWDGTTNSLLYDSLTLYGPDSDRFVDSIFFNPSTSTLYVQDSEGHGFPAVKIFGYPGAYDIVTRFQPPTNVVIPPGTWSRTLDGTPWVQFGTPRVWNFTGLPPIPATAYDLAGIGAGAGGEIVQNSLGDIFVVGQDPPVQPKWFQKFGANFSIVETITLLEGSVVLPNSFGLANRFIYVIGSTSKAWLWNGVGGGYQEPNIGEAATVYTPAWGGNTVYFVTGGNSGTVFTTSQV